MINWNRSLEQAAIAGTGSARGPAGQRIVWDAKVVRRGTEVRIRLHCDPSAGVAGARLAWLLGAGADRQVRESMCAFKEVMGAGEILTNGGQPGGTCVG